LLRQLKLGFSGGRAEIEYSESGRPMPERHVFPRNENAVSHQLEIVVPDWISWHEWNDQLGASLIAASCLLHPL
jgi:hypothetical protein